MTTPNTFRCALILVSLTVLAATSCRDSNGEGKGERLARVYDNYLYEGDLEGAYTPGLTARDSQSVRKQFIDKWISEQLILDRAVNNTDRFTAEINAKTEAYRNSLITYYYEKEYVRHKLDTNVADKEIEEYYNKHAEEFTLRDNIVRVAFVKLNLDAPSLGQVRGFLQSQDPDDRAKLRDYCERNAVNYYLEDNVWLLFDNLLREIPIKTYNQEAFLQNNRFVEMKDSMYHYMVDIKGFRIKESVSPLSFERGNIRNIIINKRKIAIIDELRRNILTRAVEAGDFEIYGEEETQ